MMSVATLKMDGKDFVVLPKREYERMLAKLEALAAQERGDVAEAKRRAKERSIPLDVLRKRLGR